ncbi:MAG: terminase TerL endonuclease subunit [Actinomycetota bacterium]
MALTEVERFARFAKLAGLNLEPFQLEVMEAVLGPHREVTISQPRGEGKTTLLGCYGLYELARHPEATIICAAAARDQAQHLFRAAERFAKHLEDLRGQLTFTLREIRTAAGGRLVVVSADAEKQMGWDPRLVIVDELGSHRDDRLYVSLRSALIKDPAARMRIVSTMGGHEDAPMPTMRRRVLEEGAAVREGAVLRAETQDSLWLEWSVPEDGDIDDIGGIVKDANPRQAITVEALAEHRRVLREVSYRRLHCNQHVASEAVFVTADAWDRCAGTPEIADGDRVVVGVDASVAHDTTAVVVVRKDDDDILHALWRVWIPSERREVPLADVEQHVRELAERYTVAAVVYDRAYFSQAAQGLDDEGIPIKEWRYNRNAEACRALHEAIVHERLRHGGADVPRRHALAAETKSREWGEVLSKSASREPIDCLMALAYAVYEASSMVPPQRSRYSDGGELVVA